MLAHSTRRRFLGTSLLATVAASVTARAATSDADDPRFPPGPILDANAYTGHWPFRRLLADEPDALVDRLRSRGVERAWVGSFEGVFHDDLGSANARLAATCHAHDGVLVPFGSVNPMLPDWPEELRRCRDEHGMPGIRLHPNYHGYALDDPAFDRLLDLAAERGLIVQVVAWMEDERQQHPLMQVPEVDLAPLLPRLERRPGLRLVVLNGFTAPTTPAVRPLLESGLAWFDIARLDALDGLATLLTIAPAERLLFGSFSPMFYPESSLLKLTESALEGPRARAILAANARRLTA
jgi:predicted TIM-barrel fold metal-dependent hydrolase